MRPLVLSAVSATALACLAGWAAAEDANSSKATITQSGPNGSSTVTRSTNGSQTITRRSGNSTATITQGSGSGSTAKGAEANRTADEMKDEAAARLGCDDAGKNGAAQSASRDRGRGAAIAGAVAGVDIDDVLPGCEDAAEGGSAPKTGSGGAKNASGAGSGTNSSAVPPKPTPAPDRRSDAADVLERRMDPAGRLPALDARVARETGRSLGAAQSLRRIVRQATN